MLWGELSTAVADQSADVKALLQNTNAACGHLAVLPVAFAMPMLGISGASATVGLQIGYSLADIAAKCAYGFMIYGIARAKMQAEGLSHEETTAQLVQTI